jgi:AcrR family transcriptional regulator
VSSFTNSVWLRPPRTPKAGQQPTLSRDQIVRAAIEILDSEGTAGLSMRRLGSRLGSGATSLYWYVAHKDELMELVVDHVFGEVYVPEVGDTDWRIGASVMCTGMRDMLIRHPWVLGQLGSRPNLGPNAMTMGNRVVALLVAAGFAGISVTHAGSMFMSHAIGAATAAAATAAAAKDSGQSLTEMADALRPHVAEIAKDHPDYAKWFAEISPDINQATVFDEGFQFGLERIIDGLDLWLKTHR